MCYELNGALAALLRGPGYGVDLLPARVFQRTGERAGELGPPYDHLALRVTVPDGGGATLVDRRLLLIGAGDRREVRELGDGEVVPALRDHFGVTLDREPVVAPI